MKLLLVLVHRSPPLVSCEILSEKLSLVQAVVAAAAAADGDEALVGLSYRPDYLYICNCVSDVSMRVPGK